MINLLRFLWFACLVRPLVLLLLGLNVRNRHLLLHDSPSIIVANHNSHLDTMVLISLFPLARLNKIRPVAAEDYFCKNRWMAWFSTRIIGIIPLNRSKRIGKHDPLEGCSQALANGDSLILFPEGSRGEPEKLSAFRTGVAHLARRHPEVPIIPVFMHGLGRALPRGEWILVPVVCDVAIGEPLFWNGVRKDFMVELESSIQSLAAQSLPTGWSDA